MPSPIKSKRGKEASKNSKKGGGGEKETERAVAGGGFLVSEVTDQSPHTSLKDVRSINHESKDVSSTNHESKDVSSTNHESKDVSSTNHESISVKSVPQSTKTPPQKVRSSSSSSGEDSDGVGEVAMVTARSVFEGSAWGRNVKNTRGRGKGRGKNMRGKK